MVRTLYFPLKSLLKLNLQFLIMVEILHQLQRYLREARVSCLDEF